MCAGTIARTAWILVRGRLRTRVDEYGCVGKCGSQEYKVFHTHNIVLSLFRVKQSRGVNTRTLLLSALAEKLHVGACSPADESTKQFAEFQIVCNRLSNLAITFP